MAFEKGKSGNALGKPKGTKNKASINLREAITSFLEEGFEKVVKDFEKLSPKDRCKLYIDLLQYSLPKLQSTNLNAEINPSESISNIHFQIKRRAEN